MRIEKPDPLLEKYQRRAAAHEYEHSDVLSWVVALVLLGIVGVVVALTALSMSVPPQAPQRVHRP